MSSEKYHLGAIKVLDKGFVKLVDIMGGDDAIVQAARVSYGKGTTKKNRDEALIRYLLRHRHTTPFEMVDLKWHAKMPIFVARQWVRHRTASINEYSLRYSESKNDFYIPQPERIKLQSKLNKQGDSEEDIDLKLVEKTINSIKTTSNQAMKRYGELEEAGVAREIARLVLPLNLYTEWYWKNDLHNTFHFLNLRMDKHAQWEIRQYANAMAEIIKEKVPIAYQAFEDYILNGMSFSKLEKASLSEKIPKRIIEDLQDDLIYKIILSIGDIKKISNLEGLHTLYVNKESGKDSYEDFSMKLKLEDLSPAKNIFETREFITKLETLKQS